MMWVQTQGHLKCICTKSVAVDALIRIATGTYEWATLLSLYACQDHNNTPDLFSSCVYSFSINRYSNFHSQLVTFFCVQIKYTKWLHIFSMAIVWSVKCNYSLIYIPNPIFKRKKDKQRANKKKTHTHQNNIQYDKTKYSELWVISSEDDSFVYFLRVQIIELLLRLERKKNVMKQAFEWIYYDGNNIWNERIVHDIHKPVLEYWQETEWEEKNQNTHHSIAWDERKMIHRFLFIQWHSAEWQTRNLSIDHVTWTTTSPEPRAHKMNITEPISYEYINNVLNSCLLFAMAIVIKFFSKIRLLDLIRHCTVMACDRLMENIT